ncbi:NAD(P)/FAD-dependent oxidoreductase [Bauldia sp.]|uniref:NAD(P)/FAD-dependent oxidoreductase n=1 Tax=Bauldia sp. TaxID=2575872 RepID=UPI003BA8543A
MTVGRRAVEGGRLPDAPSLYAASTDPVPVYPQLVGSVRADVAIIGGGFTGLSAALHLAERGIDAVLLEANSVGWGASGRNGGQLHSGQRRDQDWLEKRFGLDTARQLLQLGEEAKATTLDLITRYRIDCDWRLGLIDAVHSPRLVDDERRYVDKLRSDYGYEAVTWLHRDALAETISTEHYHGGRRDNGAGHLDPLKFARGLARAAAGAGARILEDSQVTRIVRGRSWTVETAEGRVDCETVILAGNGYLEGIDKEAEAHVMPIDNYILATAPIGAGAAGGPIPAGEAASDTRFVVYYFRPTADGRLIFGGGETYGRRDPADIAAFVRRHFLKVYPDMADTRIDHAWGGRLAITTNRLPFIRRLKPGLYTAGGYSGQGVALAPFAGKVIADAIADNPGRFDAFAAIPQRRFPGGRLLRYPALVAGMTWYALRDRL